MSKIVLQNCNSTLVELPNFQTLKGMRNVLLTVKNHRLMVSKFKETGSLNVPPGRGRKPLKVETVEKV